MGAKRAGTGLRVNANMTGNRFPGMAGIRFAVSEVGVVW